jgi:hypothetical protein
VTPISDERRAFQVVARSLRWALRARHQRQGIDELFAGRLDEEGLRRLFAVPDADVFTPVIAKDGHTVVFGRRGRIEEDGFYVTDFDGTAPPRRVTATPPDDIQSAVNAILPDASSFIVSRRGPDARGDLYLVTIPARARPCGLKPIVTGPADETDESPPTAGSSPTSRTSRDDARSTSPRSAPVGRSGLRGARQKPA